MSLRRFFEISTLQKDRAGDQRFVAVFWLGAGGGYGKEVKLPRKVDKMYLRLPICPELKVW